MLIVMFQVPPVQDVPPPPVDQYVTMQSQSQSQWRPQTFGACFEQPHEQLQLQEQQQELEQVCFIKLCFVIVYIVC